MKFNLKTGIAAGLAAAAMMVASAANAVTTIGNFSQTNENQTAVSWNQNSDLLVHIVAGGIPVNFKFIGQPMQSALLTLNASSTSPANTLFGSVAQGGFNGSFSFTNGMTNLLTGTFTNAVLGGQIGTTSGFFLNSAGGTVNFTSASFDLSPYASFGFSFSLQGVSPSLGTQGGQIRNFTSTIGGQVSAAIPEPGTWAMMIFGFGVVGFALRRRSVLATA